MRGDDFVGLICGLGWRQKFLPQTSRLLDFGDRLFGFGDELFDFEDIAAGQGTLLLVKKICKVSNVQELK